MHAGATMPDVPVRPVPVRPDVPVRVETALFSTARHATLCECSVLPHGVTSDLSFKTSGTGVRLLWAPIILRKVPTATQMQRLETRLEHWNGR